MGNRFTGDRRDYERLNKLRNQLFSKPKNDDSWSVVLGNVNDPEPGEVLSDDTGFAVYLGTFQHARNLSLLRDKRVTHVLNMAATDCPTPEGLYGDSIRCNSIKASDVEHYDISQHFTETCEFIEQVREERGRVLVHCVAGVSRSVTIVTAYLMRCHNMSLSEAAKIVNSKRTQSYPNIAFMKCLAELDEELKVKRSKHVT